MVSHCHISVAKNTLLKIEDKIPWKVNKLAYTFGSIAPDINCVYPVHTINSTLKRFRRKLVRVINSSNNLVRSFTLGVIMHYICDYFSLMHNNSNHDIRHRIYEKSMTKHLKNHRLFLNYSDKELEIKWNNIENAIINSTFNANTDDAGSFVERLANDQYENINTILNMMLSMHTEYITEAEPNSKVTTSESIKWFTDNTRMQIDLAYACKVCEHIGKMITNPYCEYTRVVTA